jgi:PAS domain S-box-containing protein
MANPAICLMLNMPLSQLVGKHISDFIPIDENQRWAGDWRSLIDGKRQALSTENDILRNDGFRMPVEARSVVIRTMPTFVQTVVHDLTETKANERRIKALNDELLEAYDATLLGWSLALEMRDNETEGHTRRVTDLTVRLARALGINEEEIVNIRRGALLHDIGKLAVPDSILLKPGKLNDEERVLMQQHSVMAGRMLEHISYLRPSISIPLYHHERWDGSGYPQGLQGEEIPLAARLFALVDVWDALRSARPYKEPWSFEEARAEIQAKSGLHFDPRIVNVFIDLVDRDRAAETDIRFELVQSENVKNEYDTAAFVHPKTNAVAQ